MAVGIRYANAVHTVSPSYAKEILKPSNPPAYYGGEGLEADLANAEKSGRLFGILNGCEYPQDRMVAKLRFPNYQTTAITGNELDRSARHSLSGSSDRIGETKRPYICFRHHQHGSDQRDRIVDQRCSFYGRQDRMENPVFEAFLIFSESGRVYPFRHRRPGI